MTDIVKTLEDALEVIKKQKAEIEKLERIERFADQVIKNQQAEIERLRLDVMQARGRGKIAINEFAERFKEKAGSIVTSCQGYEIYETKQYQISAINFDNLVKEMTEVSE